MVLMTVSLKSEPSKTPVIGKVVLLFQAKDQFANPNYDLNENFSLWLQADYGGKKMETLVVYLISVLLLFIRECSSGFDE